MRNVSTQAKSALFAQETSEAFLCLLKINHSTWAQPFYFVNDRANHTDSSSIEWIGFPFSIMLPDEKDDEIPQAVLSIDNIDREIVAVLRALSTPCTVTIWIVLGSDIDDIVAGPYDFAFNAATWNALTVSGVLEYEPILNMRWPEHDFSPITTPGLFKA